MVASIEDQIHQHFKDLEEARCRELEAKRDRGEPGATTSIERRTVRKPWTRPGENALCQEGEFLVLVKDLDYDLSDAGFQAYCLARGVIHVAGEPGSKTWRFFEVHSKAQDEFLADPDLQQAQEHEGRRYRFTPSEMAVNWQIIELGRAKLQDCWELYMRKRQA